MRSVTPAKTRHFEDSIKFFVRQKYKGLPVEIPLRVNIQFHIVRPKKPTHKLHPATRPDIDNYIKAIFDACNKFVWKDDGLICDVRAQKVFATASPKIIISVEAL